MDSTLCIGIDVSQNWLDLATHPTGELRRFKTTPAADLPLQEGEMAFRAGQACAGELPGLVLLPRLVPHQLVAAGDQVAHGLLGERRRRLRVYLVDVGEPCDDGSVDAIGLGQDAGGAGIVTDVAGVEDGEGELGVGERVGEGAFVAAGGL